MQQKKQKLDAHTAAATDTKIGLKNGKCFYISNPKR